MTKEDPDILRVYTKDLLSLEASGRCCEVCWRPMSEHEWADLDREGFVVACNYDN